MRPPVNFASLETVVEMHEGSFRIESQMIGESGPWAVEWTGGQAGAGGWSGVARTELLTGESRQSTVGVRFEILDWSRDVYVVMPGAVYAGNRFPAMACDYPPMLPARGSGDPDRLPLVSEEPRLRYEDGPSCLRQMSSDPSVPAIGFYFPAKKLGVWILTPQANDLGLFGYELKENADRTAASLTIFSPGMRREFSYRICCDREPSIDRARDFRAGDVVEIPLRIEEFACESVQGLFDALIPLRRAMVPAPIIRHDIPFSEAWRILEDKYLRENWVEPGGYFSVGVDPMRSRSATQSWQMGWVGGMLTPHALFVRGGERAVECALRNFDFVFPGGQAPSGYFYGIGDGKEFFGEEFERVPGDRRSLVRKSADGLF